MELQQNDTKSQKTSQVTNKRFWICFIVYIVGPDPNHSECIKVSTKFNIIKKKQQPKSRIKHHPEVN